MSHISSWTNTTVQLAIKINNKQIIISEKLAIWLLDLVT